MTRRGTRGRGPETKHNVYASGAGYPVHNRAVAQSSEVGSEAANVGRGRASARRGGYRGVGKSGGRTCIASDARAEMPLPGLRAELTHPQILSVSAGPGACPPRPLAQPPSRLKLPVPLPPTNPTRPPPLPERLAHPPPPPGRFSRAPRRKSPTQGFLLPDATISAAATASLPHRCEINVPSQHGIWNSDQLPAAIRDEMLPVLNKVLQKQLTGSNYNSFLDRVLYWHPGVPQELKVVNQSLGVESHHGGVLSVEHIWAVICDFNKQNRLLRLIQDRGPDFGLSLLIILELCFQIAFSGRLISTRSGIACTDMMETLALHVDCPPLNPTFVLKFGLVCRKLMHTVRVSMAPRFAQLHFFNHKESRNLALYCSKDSNVPPQDVALVMDNEGLRHVDHCLWQMAAELTIGGPALSRPPRFGCLSRRDAMAIVFERLNHLSMKLFGVPMALYGSAVTGFATRGSDIDVVMQLSDEQVGATLDEIREAAQSGALDINPFPSRKQDFSPYRSAVGDWAWIKTKPPKVVVSIWIGRKIAWAVHRLYGWSVQCVPEAYIPLVKFLAAVTEDGQPVPIPTQLRPDCSAEVDLERVLNHTVGIRMTDWLLAGDDPELCVSPGATEPATDVVDGGDWYVPLGVTFAAEESLAHQCCKYNALKLAAMNVVAEQQYSSWMPSYAIPQDSCEADLVTAARTVLLKFASDEVKGSGRARRPQLPLPLSGTRNAEGTENAYEAELIRRDQAAKLVIASLRLSLRRRNQKLAERVMHVPSRKGRSRCPEESEHKQTMTGKVGNDRGGNPDGIESRRLVTGKSCRGAQWLIPVGLERPALWRSGRSAEPQCHGRNQIVDSMVDEQDEYDDDQNEETPFGLDDGRLSDFVGGRNDFNKEIWIVEADCSFGRTVGIHNSRLLRAYASTDQKVVALGLLLKHWAKCNGIGDAAAGFLSGYHWILLMVHYLQHFYCLQVPPVLEIAPEYRELQQRLATQGLDPKSLVPLLPNLQREMPVLGIQCGHMTAQDNESDIEPWCYHPSIGPNYDIPENMIHPGPSIAEVFAPSGVPPVQAVSCINQSAVAASSLAQPDAQQLPKQQVTRGVETDTVLEQSASQCTNKKQRRSQKTAAFHDIAKGTMNSRGSPWPEDQWLMTNPLQYAVTCLTCPFDIAPTDPRTLRVEEQRGTTGKAAKLGAVELSVPKPRQAAVVEKSEEDENDDSIVQLWKMRIVSAPRPPDCREMDHLRLEKWNAARLAVHEQLRSGRQSSGLVGEMISIPATRHAAQTMPVAEAELEKTSRIQGKETIAEIKQQPVLSGVAPSDSRSVDVSRETSFPSLREARLRQFYVDHFVSRESLALKFEGNLTLAELFYGFFEYYGLRFNWATDVADPNRVCEFPASKKETFSTIVVGGKKTKKKVRLKVNEPQKNVRPVKPNDTATEANRHEKPTMPKQRAQTEELQQNLTMQSDNHSLNLSSRPTADSTASNGLSSSSAERITSPANAPLHDEADMAETCGTKRCDSIVNIVTMAPLGIHPEETSAGTTVASGCLTTATEVSSSAVGAAALDALVVMENRGAPSPLQIFPLPPVGAERTQRRLSGGVDQGSPDISNSIIPGDTATPSAHAEDGPRESQRDELLLSHLQYPTIKFLSSSNWKLWRPNASQANQSIGRGFGGRQFHERRYLCLRDPVEKQRTIGPSMGCYAQGCISDAFLRGLQLFGQLAMTGGSEGRETRAKIVSAFFAPSGKPKRLAKLPLQFFLDSSACPMPKKTAAMYRQLASVMEKVVQPSRGTPAIDGFEGQAIRGEQRHHSVGSGPKGSAAVEDDRGNAPRTSRYRNDRPGTAAVTTSTGSSIAKAPGLTVSAHSQAVASFRAELYDSAKFPPLGVPPLRRQGRYGG